MTIKRKTQLNLSGSHRTLDADNAFVGGFLFVTGSVSASVGVSASSGFQAGGSSTFKAATFDGTLSASNYIATANSLYVGQNAFVTGSLQVTGSVAVAESVTAGGIISGSTGRFTYLSGALSASSTGQPFILAGSGVTTTFSHTNLNWTIAATGGGGTVQGNDTEIQFNQNNAFAASSSLTHRSGTLGVHALSGSLASSGTVLGNNGYNGHLLLISGSMIASKSLLFFDGVDPLAGQDGDGGIIIQNGGQIQLSSGSLFMGEGVADLFAVRSSRIAGEVDIISNGINIKALTGSVTTGPTGYGGNTNILSSSLLTRTIEPNCVGKFDISVLGAATGSGDFISADIVAVASKSSAGTFGIFGITERNIDTIGTNAASWDVNINDDGGIAVTGSGGTVRWYGQVTKMMILSGSDNGQTIVVY